MDISLSFFLADLIKVWSLTPESETQSVGLSYNQGIIGDVGPDNFFFLRAEESPSGKEGVIFQGKYSSTLSFWEFECEE